MLAPITDTTGTDCLLVVSANKAEVTSLVSMLGKVGFEILPAPTGKQGIQMLAARRPDLILLDLHLPDMDGLEMCRLVQENSDWVDIPIVFLSQDQDKNLVARALESGGVDYITMPIHKQELLSRVRTQLMLKTSRDHARRIAQDKDEALGMISHHLQNHLVGMHMSAQMLLEHAQAETDPKLVLMAENIRSSSGRMRVFLKAFLANAAADHGINLRLEPVDLSHATSRVLQQYEDFARAKDIFLSSNISPQAMVCGDVHALNQVLDNLISNAVKFSPHGKEILVVVRPAQDLFEFRVEDHGAGFTDADKAQMFRRYARLSAQPTGGEPSSGLGLSIVKKLVDAMHGELVCDSTPGVGSTFTVRLTPALGGRAIVGDSD